MRARAKRALSDHSELARAIKFVITPFVSCAGSILAAWNAARGSCLLLLGFCSAGTSPLERRRSLSADEVKEALENQDVFLLDMREPKETEELGTIKGYVNIPVDQLEKQLAEIPKNKSIVTA